MAQTRQMIGAPSWPGWTVGRLRVAIVMTALIVWELIAASGLLFRDVVPSFLRIGAAFGQLLGHLPFWMNLGVTAWEVFAAMLIGGVAGLATGLALGAVPFLAAAFERYLVYLAPTPKIILFPVLIMAFGVGWGSKIAMGAFSCFFPIAISVATGMRQVDQSLIKVGLSLRLSTWQMMTKIYLPAIRTAATNGMRLGFGVAIIGVLLSETKLSNQGLGYLIIQSYARFDMPQMYALLLTAFTLAIVGNNVFSRMTR